MQIVIEEREKGGGEPKNKKIRRRTPLPRINWWRGFLYRDIIFRCDFPKWCNKKPHQPKHSNILGWCVTISEEWAPNERSRSIIPIQFPLDLIGLKSINICYLNNTEKESYSGEQTRKSAVCKCPLGAQFTLRLFRVGNAIPKVERNVERESREKIVICSRVAVSFVSWHSSHVTGPLYCLITNRLCCCQV